MIVAWFLYARLLAYRSTSSPSPTGRTEPPCAFCLSIRQPSSSVGYYLDTPSSASSLREMTRARGCMRGGRSKTKMTTCRSATVSTHVHRAKCRDLFPCTPTRSSPAAHHHLVYPLYTSSFVRLRLHDFCAVLPTSLLAALLQFRGIRGCYVESLAGLCPVNGRSTAPIMHLAQICFLTATVPLWSTLTKRTGPASRKECATMRDCSVTSAGLCLTFAPDCPHLRKAGIGNTYVYRLYLLLC